MVSVCKHFWGYAPIGPETMNLKLSVILMSAFAAACANAVTDFTVNGTKVTAAQQEQILKNLTARGQQRTPQLENAVKQNLVTEIAVLQEAQKAGLANDPNVKIAVQNATNNIMTEALLNRYVQQHPTSDADLQKMYQKDKAAYGNTEYHLRQIVTKTQGEAQNALNRVLKGENFAKVASAVTIDQPSKARGGDIGWFAPVRPSRPVRFTRSPCSSAAAGPCSRWWLRVPRSFSRPLNRLSPSFSELLPLRPRSSTCVTSPPVLS